MTSKFHVTSRNFHLGECHLGKLTNTTSGRTIHELLCTITDRINECLAEYPEAKHLSIQYRNILERDTNPKGHVGFFMINNDNDFSYIDKLRDPNFEDFPEHRPYIRVIKAQDGDLVDPWEGNKCST